jgi:DNA-directed RNA polymerase beta subunit
MEDAMVINKSSVERGFAHGAIYASEVRKDFFLKRIQYDLKIFIVN